MRAAWLALSLVTVQGCCVDQLRGDRQRSLGQASAGGRQVRALCSVSPYQGRDLYLGGGCTIGLQIELDGAPPYLVDGGVHQGCSELERRCKEEKTSVEAAVRGEALAVVVTSSTLLPDGRGLYYVGDARPIEWQAQSLAALPPLDEVIDARLSTGKALPNLETSHEDGLFPVLLADQARFARHAPALLAATPRCQVPTQAEERLVTVAEPRAAGRALLESFVRCAGGRVAVNDIVFEKKGLPFAPELVVEKLRGSDDVGPLPTQRLALVASRYGVREAAPLLEARLVPVKSPGAYEPGYPQWLGVVEEIAKLDEPRAGRLLVAELGRSRVEAKEPCVFPHRQGVMASSPQDSTERWPGHVGARLRPIDDPATRAGLVRVVKDRGASTTARQIALLLLRLRRAPEAQALSSAVSLTRCQQQLLDEQLADGGAGQP